VPQDPPRSLVTTERKDRSPGARSTSRRMGRCPAWATGKALPSYGVPIVCTTNMLRIYERLPPLLNYLLTLYS